MNREFVIVFSGEGLPTLKQRCGTGNWVVKTESFLPVDYVLIVRNLKQSFPDNKDGYEHGQAFFLGKLQEVKQSKEEPNRKVIQISEYITLPKNDSFKDAWTSLTNSQRYPIAYQDLSKLLEYLEGKDLSEWFEYLEGKDLSELLEYLEGKDLSELLEYLEGKDHSELLEYLKGKDRSELLEYLEGKDRSELLEYLEGKDRSELLEYLKGKGRSELLEYLKNRKINLENLPWEKMHPAHEENNLTPHTESSPSTLTDIINEARHKIAKAANVDESKVNIQISF